MNPLWRERATVCTRPCTNTTACPEGTMTYPRASVRTCGLKIRSACAPRRCLHPSWSCSSAKPADDDSGVGRTDGSCDPRIPARYCGSRSRLSQPPNIRSGVGPSSWVLTKRPAGETGSERGNGRGFPRDGSFLFTWADSLYTSR
eukprot:154211-Pleurochrysis_carterae.AAC.3